MHAGVDQIAGGLHGFRSANAFEDGGYGVSMDQGVLARIQRIVRRPANGSANARAPDQGVNLLGQGVGCGRNQLRQRLGLREGGLGYGVCLHPAECTFCDSGSQ